MVALIESKKAVAEGIRALGPIHSGPPLPPKKKRRVNFNLTIDIKHPEDACVPTGPHSLSDFSDVESLSEPLPTTPGGKPQVR